MTGCVCVFVFYTCRYLPELTLSENINLPPTLLSRFDLVYLVLDKHDEDRDRKLAKHLVSLFWADAPEQTQPVSRDMSRHAVRSVV
jgi:DNA replicative helicase MCM subunit Mcm2 (Cdc46/Mcm family)